MKSISIFPCLFVGVGLWIVASCSDNKFLDEMRTAHGSIDLITRLLKNGIATLSRMLINRDGLCL